MLEICTVEQGNEGGWKSLADEGGKHIISLGLMQGDEQHADKKEKIEQAGPH